MINYDTDRGINVTTRTGKSNWYAAQLKHDLIDIIFLQTTVIQSSLLSMPGHSIRAIIHVCRAMRHQHRPWCIYSKVSLICDWNFYYLFIYLFSQITNFTSERINSDYYYYEPTSWDVWLIFWFNFIFVFDLCLHRWHTSGHAPRAQPYNDNGIAESGCYIDGRCIDHKCIIHYKYVYYRCCHWRILLCSYVRIGYNGTLFGYLIYTNIIIIII